MRSAHPGFICLISPCFALAMAACSSSATKPGPDAGPDRAPATDTSLDVPDSAVPDTETPGETARPALLTVTPTSIELGVVQPGVTSPPQAITITAADTVTNLTVTTPDGNLTLQSSTCGNTLARGTSCVVTLVFAAPTTGVKQDRVVVAGGGYLTTVTVSATVTNGGHLVIIPSASQSFSASVGQSSTPLTFAIPNAGSETAGPVTVAITGADAGQFVIAANDCAYIAPLTTCTIAVVFRPTVLGASAAILTVTAGASGSAAVPLSGTGWSDGHPVLTPVQGDLGAVAVGTTGPSVTYTVTNTSAAAVTMSTVTLSSPEFVLTADHCGGTSVPGRNGTCTIAVALRPTSAGSKSAHLTVTPAAGSPTVKTLTGIGVLLVDGGIDAHQDAAMDAAIDLQPSEAGIPTVDGSTG